MADLPHVVTSLGDILPHTVKVAEEITTAFQPIYYVWGYADSGEHEEGRALDFMTYTYGGGVDSPGPVREQFGWDIARYLWRHRERLGVWYVIYRRRIISQTDPEDGWEWMEDRGGPSANHMDHVHVSFYWDAPDYRPPAVEEDDMSVWYEDLPPNQSAREIAGWQFEDANAAGYLIGTAARTRVLHTEMVPEVAADVKALTGQVSALTALVQALSEKVDALTNKETQA